MFWKRLGSSWWCRLGILILLLAGLADVGCAGLPGERSQTLRSAASVVVDNSFGFDIHNPVAHWPSEPFHYWRMWDDSVDWAHVEPSPGVFDFSLLDQYVALASLHHVTVIYVAGNTPTWAAQDPSSVGTEGIAGCNSPPANLQDWQTFIQTLATRYKGRIQAYEIWNEANLRGYWTGDVNEMLQMARAAYSTIKTIDPSAVVLAPSLVAGSGIGWLSNFIAAGGAQFTDAIPFHLYDTAKLPEEAVGFYDQVLALAQKANKPIWDTEVGWGPWGTFSDTEAASFLARTFILQSALGVTHIIWYAWDDRGPWVHLYLVKPDMNTPTLAAVAFAQVESWLEGTTVTCTSQPDNSWQCQLDGTDGTVKYIVWNPSNNSTLTSPPSWKLGHIRDLQGTVQPIRGGTVGLDSMPVLLEP